MLKLINIPGGLVYSDNMIDCIPVQCFKIKKYIMFIKQIVINKNS